MYIFIAYTHTSGEDRKLCQKLIRHLRPLSKIGLWHYDNLLGGAEYETEIEKQLEAAQIILLLVSQDFLTSDDYRQVVEHKNKSARIIPILLRPSNYENDPFITRFHMLPKDGKPVTSHKDVDETLTTIVKEIQRVISELRKQPPSTQPRTFEVLQATTANQNLPQTENPRTGKEQTIPFNLQAIQFSPWVIDTASKVIHFILRMIQQYWIKIKTHWRTLVPIALVLIILMPTIYSFLSSRQPHNVTPTNQPLILISDGRYPFDTYRADGQLKMEAAQALKDGDTKAANALWVLALKEEPNDAETGIYIENQNALDSHLSYLTFVVTIAAPIGPYTPYTDKFYASTIVQDILQGAYIAQQEYNQPFSSSRIRLLIADLGPNSQYEEQAVSQIIQRAKKENIVGIIGQPLSSNSSIVQLNTAHIPMTSSVEAFNKQDSSAEDECNPQPTTLFSFSIAPTLEREGTLGALYAEQELHAQKALVISDTQNYYSNCLATAFSNQFQQDGKTLAEAIHYAVGNIGDLLATIQAEKNADRDITLIYFAGFPGDLCPILPQILQTYSDIHVMGGDALYHLVYAPDIPPDSTSPNNVSTDCPRSNFNGLYFTAFAFPDEPGMKSLLDRYTKAFDPQKQNLSTYGYSRIDSDAALSYDALHTFLQLSQRILSDSNKQSLSPEELQQMLLKVTHDNSLQGATGQIFFDASGTPPAKDVLFLYVAPRGLQLLAKSSDVE